MVYQSTRQPTLPFKASITVEDVLNSAMIAYPFRLLQCCLVTSGGSASTRKIATLAWYVVGEAERSGIGNMAANSILVAAHLPLTATI
jgi:hypothetical protein